eukprot:COSAG01_NODE_1110_length_11657_cov_5.360616_9_plen_165_part_00
MSRAFPSWKRSILTDIYLCHACSYHEIEDGNARADAYYIRYAIDMYDRTVSVNSKTQMDTVEGVFNDLEKEPFVLLCVKTYQAARDSGMATAYEQDYLGEDGPPLSDAKIDTMCRMMVTPDTLQTHCAATIWGDIDTNAPWLRGLLTVLLASLVPSIVGVAVGE